MTIILGILISCSENKTKSEIKNYINNIDNHTYLNKSITEFNNENLNGQIHGGTLIYTLTDRDNKLY